MNNNTNMKFGYEYPEINMNDIQNAKVISLIGPSGSGKTSFCNEILKNCPNSLHIDLDKKFFQECKEDPALFEKSLRSIIKTIKENRNNGQIMIFDGNYKAARKKVWNRCDIIYYLDIHPLCRIKNVICREFKNLWNNCENEIGRPANFTMLIYNTFICSNKSLIWHASGMDFHKKQLDEGIVTYLKESQENYKRHIEKRNERIKNGQTPKELMKEPCKITYMSGEFYLKINDFDIFIGFICIFYPLLYLFFINF